MGYASAILLKVDPWFRKLEMCVIALGKTTYHPISFLQSCFALQADHSWTLALSDMMISMICADSHGAIEDVQTRNYNKAVWYISCKRELQPVLLFCGLRAISQLWKSCQSSELCATIYLLAIADLWISNACAGNVGNLPIVLVQSICANDNTIFAKALPQGACAENGIAYIAFSMWVASTFQFCIAIKLMEKEDPKSSLSDRRDGSSLLNKVCCTDTLRQPNLAFCQARHICTIGFIQRLCTLFKTAKVGFSSPYNRRTLTRSV